MKNDETFEIFKKNFLSLLESHGTSQRQFCLENNMPAPTLSRYMTGKRTPDITCIIKIANHFHVSIDWLLGRSTISELNDVRLVKAYNLANENEKTIVDTILKEYYD